MAQGHLVLGRAAKHDGLVSAVEKKYQAASQGRSGHIRIKVLLVAMATMVLHRSPWCPAVGKEGKRPSDHSMD